MTVESIFGPKGSDYFELKLKWRTDDKEDEMGLGYLFS
jgi:hypothetical protein